LTRVGLVVAVIVAILFNAAPALAGPSANLFASYQVAPPASAASTASAI